MSFSVIAYEVKPAPKENFPSGDNVIQGWELAKILDRYGSGEPTVWDVKEVYEKFCESLENERDALLEDLKEDGVTLDDLYRIRDFLKVCAEHDYILGTWW
ncbi:MAG TPA: hypothetical protein PKI14_07880 [Fervidobacterium sp.]|nr:hypothetical protein [Fervidobacterium sp.]